MAYSFPTSSVQLLPVMPWAASQHRHLTAQLLPWHQRVVTRMGSKTAEQGPTTCCQLQAGTCSRQQGILPCPASLHAWCQSSPLLYRPLAGNAKPRFEIRLEEKRLYLVLNLSCSSHQIQA